jgi:hypothetical protein
MRKPKFIRSIPLLCGLLLAACGGGGGSDKAENSNPNSPSTDTFIPLDKSQALTVTAQDGSVSTPLQFSPLSKDHRVFFKSYGNNSWYLQSVLPTTADTPFINPATYLSIELDEKNPSEIARFDYSQGVSERGSWGISCSQDCAEKYRYKIEQQGEKHYFVLDVAAQKQSMTIGSGKRPFTNQASVTGQIRLEIDPNWPVWTSDRFPVHEYQGSVNMNGQATPVRNLITADYEGRRVFIVELMDTKRSKLSYGFGTDELLTYTYTDDNGKEVVGFYRTIDGKPPLTEDIDRTKGVHTVNINSNGFVSDPRYTTPADITIAGQISEKIFVGSVDISGETFSPNEFSPYSNNENNYFRFTHSNTQLNIRYNPATKNFHLAYQKPQAGQLNYNIHEKFNCRQVNDNCQGIRFSEDKTTLYLEGVLLQDGRVLNGVIRNIGIKP